MNSLHVSAIILAKMAHQDDHIADEERSYLEVVCARLDDMTVESLLEQAQSEPLEELVVKLDRYPDRFFIAMRAYMMANIDQDYDSAERAFFRKLVELLEIPQEDLALIKEAEVATRAIEPTAPNPRILELFKASSFAQASGG